MTYPSNTMSITGDDMLGRRAHQAEPSKTAQAIRSSGTVPDELMAKINRASVRLYEPGGDRDKFMVEMLAAVKRDRRAVESLLDKQEARYSKKLVTPGEVIREAAEFTNLLGGDTVGVRLRHDDGSEVMADLPVPMMQEMMRWGKETNNRDLIKWGKAQGLLDDAVIEATAKTEGGVEMATESRLMEVDGEVDWDQVAVGNIPINVKLTPQGKAVAERRVMPVSPSNLFLMHRMMNPQLWDEMTPRIYKNADKWCDPRYASVYLMGSIMMLADPGLSMEEKTSGATIEKAITGAVMHEHRMPMFFVTRDLFEAARKTKAPAVNWRDLKLPHEAAAFILPVNAFKSPLGGEVACITYCRIKGGKLYKMPGTGQRMKPLDRGLGDRDELVMTGIDRVHLVDFHRCEYKAEYDPDQKAGYERDDDFLIATRETRDNVMTVHDAKVIDMTDDTDEYKRFNSELADICINLLLLMQERPDVIGRDSGRKVGRHKRTGQELWTPNVIGQGYRVQKMSGPKGSHASPRWHWRRGHWRQQPVGHIHCKICGQRKAGHDKGGWCKVNHALGNRAVWEHSGGTRVTWVEPCLVNFKEERDEEKSS